MVLPTPLCPRRSTLSPRSMKSREECKCSYRLRLMERGWFQSKRSRVAEFSVKVGFGDVVIDASIVVDRESQKAIVVGKGGTMIRDVGMAARKEITELVGKPVHLRLNVRVEEGWTTSPQGLAELGYGEEDR